MGVFIASGAVAACVALSFTDEYSWRLVELRLGDRVPARMTPLNTALDLAVLTACPVGAAERMPPRLAPRALCMCAGRFEG